MYFSLGSNVGNREEHLREALRRMDEAFGCHWTRLSDFILTEAWGFDGAEFVNAAVLYELDSDPWDVLGVCKDIERSMGREEIYETDAGGARIYHDRIIDIDILLYGDRSIRSETLTVPHPLMESREFVMRPLMQIKGRALSAVK